MSNPIIEVPEEIQSTVKRVLSGKDFHMATTVELAEFIQGLNEPEIEVEPFVIYKIEVRGYDGYRMGFRFARNVPFPWVSFNSHAPGKEEAYATSANNLIHSDEDIKVIERWTPEAPEPEFGIGLPNDSVDADREVLVKGVLQSGYIDPDGDVRVTMQYSGSLTETHYISADVVAYAGEEPLGN